MVFYVDSQKSSSAEEIAFLLNKCILQYPGRWSELVFLCIGSDRVTGDCLGPYIGHQLLEHLNTDTHGVYVSVQDALYICVYYAGNIPSYSAVYSHCSASALY